MSGEKNEDRKHVMKLYFH